MDKMMIRMSQSRGQLGKILSVMEESVLVRRGSLHHLCKSTRRICYLYSTQAKLVIAIWVEEEEDEGGGSHEMSFENLT
jgi:hypothetical protein